MNSLLDLDQILIDKDERWKRVQYLYDCLHLIYIRVVKFDTPVTEETRMLYNKYVDELKGYGYGYKLFHL